MEQNDCFFIFIYDNQCFLLLSSFVSKASTCTLKTSGLMSWSHFSIDITYFIISYQSNW